MSNKHFQLDPEFKHYIPKPKAGDTPYDPEKLQKDSRKRSGHDLRLYRRNHKELGLPELKKDKDSDQYVAIIRENEVYFTPVYKLTNSIGQRGLETKWRASVGIVHPGNYHHPPEGDEVELCDSTYLVDAVICAMAHIQLEEAHRIIENREIERSIRRGTPV